MTCGLADEELFILNILYVNRCFTDKASFNLFRAKFGVDPEDSAKYLMSKGYISQKRKRDIKYYIFDMSITGFALGQHNFNVPPGRYVRRISLGMINLQACQ
jgi:hypothetical protein